MPWARSVFNANNDWPQAEIVWFLCSHTDSLLLIVTPRILILSTRGIPGMESGEIAVLRQLSVWVDEDDFCGFGFVQPKVIIRRPCFDVRQL